ncbi:MAG TPA: alpha/beta hydrolase [Thermoplasmata archaeon]|nr:alpha/beta hydrolase [Thermoplasmata archaeon]
MPVVRANGVNLYYERAGEHGEPMVLIHGAWFDRLNWNPVVPGLSHAFRVVTYDRRGHGQSETVATQGSTEEDAADAAALLTRLGMVPAHVVGHSTGSIVALKMAAAQPQVVRSLIVHEPPLMGLLANDPSTAPMLSALRIRRAAVAKLLEAGDREGGARLFVDTLMAGPGGWDRMPPQMQETFIRNADNFLDEMRNPSDANIDLKALGRFQRPALLSYGGRSPPLIRAIIDILAQAIPGSKVVSYDETGHNPHITHPEEFTRTVTAFAKSSG